MSLLQDRIYHYDLLSKWNCTWNMKMLFNYLLGLSKERLLPFLMKSGSNKAIQTILLKNLTI